MSMCFLLMPDNMLVGDYLKSLKPTSDFNQALQINNPDNAISYLGFLLSLNNCPTYQKIKLMLDANEIKVVDSDLKEVIYTEKDTTEYYAIYVVKNKERNICEQIKRNIRHNLLPNGESLLLEGLVDKDFYIGDYIYDVSFASTYGYADFTRTLTSNIHSYIFIQVEKTSTLFFNKVIIPFLKMVDGVIGVCGIQVPTKYRKTEIVRQNKQEKIKRNVIYNTQPVAISEPELEHVIRSHNSFSTYDVNEDFKIGDSVWYWRLNRKKQPIFFPMTIVKFKDDITVEVMKQGKKQTKHVVAITSLVRNRESIK